MYLMMSLDCSLHVVMNYRMDHVPHGIFEDNRMDYVPNDLIWLHSLYVMDQKYWGGGEFIDHFRATVKQYQRYQTISNIQFYWMISIYSFTKHYTIIILCYPYNLVI